MSKYKVGAYVRLSKDDSYNESDSIDNQKSIIKDYKKLNKDLVNQYIKQIEIFDKNRVKVVYKSDT